MLKSQEVRALARRIQKTGIATLCAWAWAGALRIWRSPRF